MIALSLSFDSKRMGRPRASGPVMAVVCCQDTYVQKAQRGSNVQPLWGGRQVTRSGTADKPGQNLQMDFKDRLSKNGILQEIQEACSS